MCRPRSHPLQSTLPDRRYISDRSCLSYLSLHVLICNCYLCLLSLIILPFPNTHEAKPKLQASFFFLGLCPGFGGFPAFISGPSTESEIFDSRQALISLLFFLEKQREKVDSNLFFKWFDSRLIRESTMIHESKFHNFLFNKDSRMIDDSNQDSNQFLN